MLDLLPSFSLKIIHLSLICIFAASDILLQIRNFEGPYHRALSELLIQKTMFTTRQTDNTLFPVKVDIQTDSVTLSTAV